MIQDTDFMEGLLTTLQNVTDDSGNVILVSTSACTENFNLFYTEISDIWGNIDLSLYQAALTAKGAGDGTNIGFVFDQVQGVMDLTTLGFEFYNDCKLDYYLQAFGSNLQSLSGLANFGTTTMFKLFNSGDTTLTDLVTAVAAYVLSNDATTRGDMGEAFGNFMRTLLSVEIPDTSIDMKPFYESGTSFGARRRR